MSLIAINSSTQQFNPSLINLSIISGLTPSAKTEDVVSELALDSLNEIKNSRLGCAQPIKKIVAISLTYASLLALPIAALVGTLWHVSNQIKDLTSLSQAQGHLLTGTSLSALWLADVTMGKLLGIRPFTAISIASYDVYRQFALTVSKQVRDSYSSQEKIAQEQTEINCQIVKEQLSAIYKGIADELGARHKRGAITNELQMLEKNLPIVKQALSKSGLKKVEISSILSPLQSTIQLIKAIDNK